MDANVVVLCAYLLVTTGTALWVARRKRRQAATQEGDTYFLSGRNMPGWQLGCSLVATQMSSVTFLAYPATAYATDYLLLNNCFSLPLLSVGAAIWVVPFFRRSVRLSAYELLEERFGSLACRVYVSACYCLLQLARTCTVLYLVSFPLSTLSGASHVTCIVASGAIIAMYTVCAVPP